MRPNRRQSAFTLIEMTVVIAIIAVLAVLAAPATKLLFESFETEGGVRAMIGSALASARAIAAKEHKYAGIRFQKVYDPAGPLGAGQYIVFIVHDYDLTGLANGFRAVEGVEPIKLPDSFGVMDETLIRQRRTTDPTWELSTNPELTDLTTFSIVFSPSGHLVIHYVRVRNRDAMPKWVSPDITLDNSNDDIFNTVARVTDPVNPRGMFLQDDYIAMGLAEELSRSRFIVYDREKFNQAFLAGQAYSRYLYRLITDAVYINPYTGTLVSGD